MVVHYPRTVWKNSYAEHKVTGKTNNLTRKKICMYFYFFYFTFVFLNFAHTCVRFSASATIHFIFALIHNHIAFRMYYHPINLNIYN